MVFRSRWTTGRAFVAASLVFGVTSHQANAQANIVSAMNPATYQSTWGTVVTDALKAGVTVANFVVANEAVIWADEKKGGCLIANFAVGRVFSYVVGGTVPTPFDVCGATAAGAGYYLMGQNGPGGIVPFNKFTTYLPVKSLGCSQREYNFTFSVTGPNSLSGYLSTGATLQQKQQAMFAKGNASDSWMTALSAANPNQMALNAAAAAWQAMYNVVGNFAMVAAFNPQTKGSSLYVLVPDTSKMGAAINKELTAAMSNKPFATGVAVAKSLIALVNASSPEGFTVPTVMMGGTLNDHFSMNCGVPLMFWYIAGTGNVLLN